MKNLFPFALTLFILFGCSSDSSDSPEEMEEIIIELPMLSTNDISEIGETTVTIGGSITNNGGGVISEKGIVWGTTANPTINDNKESSGSGNSAFTITLSGLEANTAYFARAYATNSEGTAYGNEISFNTIEAEPAIKVFEGDVYLDTQQKVNDFGAQGFTEITRRLWIAGLFLEFNSSITDLSPLKDLVKIGNLRIQGMKNLNSLSGLENLTEVQSVVVRNNPGLEDLSGLNNLNKVIDVVNIINNESIATLDSFNNLVSSGSVTISENPALVNITGFQNLEESQLIDIKGNPTLEKIEGFNKLLTIGYFLSIEENDTLRQIKGFSNIETIGETSSTGGSRGIYIERNKDLEMIEGFNMLTICKLIFIQRNHSLRFFEGFNNITNINSLWIDNSEISTLNAFKRLEKLEIFRFYRNSQIKNLDNFENIREISSIAIEENSQLKNIDAFSKLENSTFYSIFVGGNNTLESLAGLSSVINVTNGMSITNNPSIESLLGLGLLENVGKGFTISLNESLLNFEALTNLNSVGDYFWIVNNQKITTLEGLNNLINCDELRIQDNTVLSDFCALRPLINSGWEDSFDIRDNLFNPSKQNIIDGTCSQ